MAHPELSFLDALIVQVDHGLRTLSRIYEAEGRPSPAADAQDTLVEPVERVRAGRMMRVNHAGEVMAQALYYGQAFATRDPELREHLEKAAREEADHLVWCQARLDELHATPSRLNPLWYTAGWTMGALAALRGQGPNMGLVVEVEKQVEAHLDEHLQDLPADDMKSRAILEQMQADEIAHGEQAQIRGATPLPLPVRLAMGALSKLMTRGSLWV